MKTKSALSYFGSDSEVAESLAAMLNHCAHVTVPFCGGMSILPWLKARAVVANDLNSNAINFYRVVSGVFGNDIRDRLFNRCQHTLSHPLELGRATGFLYPNDGDVSNIDRAWAYWAMCWIGRKGKGGTRHLGGMPSVRRTANGGTNASRIRAAADDLPAWAKHFERCEWLCEDFRTVLAKVKDQPDCGIYCDPPFYGAGDAYIHSFSEKDHADLSKGLARFEKTTVVVRYGDCQEARNHYRDYRAIDAASRNQSNSDKSEVWFVKNQRAL